MQRSPKSFLASSFLFFLFCSHPPIKLLFLLPCFSASFHHFDTASYSKELSRMLISELTASQSSSSQFYSFTNVLNGKQYRKKKYAGACFLILYEKKEAHLHGIWLLMNAFRGECTWTRKLMMWENISIILSSFLWTPSRSYCLFSVRFCTLIQLIILIMHLSFIKQRRDLKATPARKHNWFISTV